MLAIDGTHVNLLWILEVMQVHMTHNNVHYDLQMYLYAEKIL